MFNNDRKDMLDLSEMDRVDIASFILQCQNYLNDITYEKFIFAELEKLHKEIKEIKDILEKKEGNNGVK